MLARAPWRRISRASRTGAAAASMWNVTLAAPASMYAAAFRSASVIIRCASIGQGVAVQGDVALAVRRQQGVVEAAYGARRVAVVHPLADGVLVGGALHLTELVEGRDP